MWPYFCLIDSIVKTKHLDERMLNERVMIGDVLAQWELMLKGATEQIRACRLYLGLKFYPFGDEESKSLLPFVYYSKAYDVYFHKAAFDRFEVTKMYSLFMQVDYGNYEDKPGVANRIKNYFHPFFTKYYNDETFISTVIEGYKELAGTPQLEYINRFAGLRGEDFVFPVHYFTARFRNSNSPAFKDLQEQLLLCVARQKISICEETSRETILDISLEQIMNWGINQDILCICYGDKYEMIKLYFQIYDPFVIAELLFIYGNYVASGEFYDYLAKNEHLEKFVTNPKNRRSNIFTFK